MKPNRSMRNRMGAAAGMAMSLLVVGCGTTGWHTEKAGPEFKDGTRVLGELVVRGTRQKILANEGLLRGWHDKMLAAGYTDSDLVDGSAVSVFTYCYAHNSGVSHCQHHGHYVAYVPPALRRGLRFVGMRSGSKQGDLVEVELRRNPDGALVGKVLRVYRKSGDWNPFRSSTLKVGGVSSALSMFAGHGPPQAMWIECDSKDTNGWRRTPVGGAPPTGGAPVSQWFKPPRRPSP